MLGSTLSSGTSTSFNVWDVADYTMYVHNRNTLHSRHSPAGDFDGDGLDDFVILSTPAMETRYGYSVRSPVSLPYLAVHSHQSRNVGLSFDRHNEYWSNRLSQNPGDLDGDVSTTSFGSSEAYSQEGLVNVFTDCD